MSNIVLSPSASGTGALTIAAPNTNSNRTLTLPDNTGTILTNATTTGFPAGSVLQVVTSTNLYNGTTSSSYVDTGLTATITPSSSTSKILVLLNMPGIASTAAVQWDFVLADGGNSILEYLLNYNAAANPTAASYSFLFSPATTSAITYKVRFRIAGGAILGLANYSVNNQKATITLMEIAA